jgi:hypothetical protein
VHHYKVDDPCVLPFMRSLSAGRNAHPVRILVTVSPLMYREVVALSIHDRRPDYEVLLAPPWPVDGRTGRFGPHVLVHDAGEPAPPRALAEDLLCRVRVRGAARVDATVEAGGAVSEVRDADLEDLFGALEGAEGLLAGEGGG